MTNYGLLKIVKNKRIADRRYNQRLKINTSTIHSNLI